MGKTKTSPAKNAGPVTKDGRPFFFNRKINLKGDEPDYTRKCLVEARKSLIKAQQDYDEDLFRELWDLRNGLTLYVVILEEIVAGHKILYVEPLTASVCMAAYLGHDRMLAILERNGVDLCSMEWNTLNVLFAAILGRHLGLVKHLLSAHPQLRTMRHLWLGNAGAFCAAFGDVRILRFLRNEGFDLTEAHRFPNQKPDDPRQFGSALLFAMQEGRDSIARDIVAHGEFCPWQNLGRENWGGEWSVFTAALKHRFFDIARTYLENGWLERPKTDDDFWELVRRAQGDEDLTTFRFLEKAFPQFDARRIVRERVENEWIDSPILRYCGVRNVKTADPYETEPESVHRLCDSISHWIKMKRPDMVRYMLNIVPEVLPLVWSELAEPIRAAFSIPSEDALPCRRYLFRLARSLGIALFPDDAARRFWERKCDEPHPWKRPLTIDEVFPYDEGLCDGGPSDGYYHPKEMREKLFRALHARGAAARQLMDNPEINPNTHLSWNSPFFASLGDHADWKTYKRWLLRGMEIYQNNIDDDGCFDLGSSPSIVRHLLPELEHRPWVSREYVGNTLVLAASYGDIGAAKAVLAAGCPVNFRRGNSYDKVSPLRAALLNGRDAMARFLFARGGMNILNGVVYPVPRWIAKPRPLNLPAIRRAVGDPSATPVLIDPIMPLPEKLFRLRAHWLEDAKELNGHCLCLIPTASDTVLFRFEGRLYVIRRESVAMEEDAYQVSFDEIFSDLKGIGCEIITFE